MKCFQCKKEIKNEAEMVILNADGDVGCNTICQQNYIKERDHFFNVIVHDEKMCEDWLLGKI